VKGYTGKCDEAIARRGIEWTRAHFRWKGIAIERPRIAAKGNRVFHQSDVHQGRLKCPLMAHSGAN
jgi:hypothetical protein